MGGPVGASRRRRLARLCLYCWALASSADRVTLAQQNEPATTGLVREVDPPTAPAAPIPAEGIPTPPSLFPTPAATTCRHPLSVLRPSNFDVTDKIEHSSTFIGRS